MNGLCLSRDFFTAEGVPLLVGSHRETMPYLAAGLVGEGSECFGVDDERSCDHDWGAGFCIWLPDDVFEKKAHCIADDLRLLPGFAGVGSKFASMAGANDGRIGVFPITGFYRRFIGFDHVPETLEEWWAVPDANLATVTNGGIFCDRWGEFSRWRESLAGGYPRDIKLKKMAYCCYLAMQAGQYNYERTVRRRLYGAAAIVEATFTMAALRLAYYLNDAYPPFYKWVQPLVKELPLLGRESFMYSEALADPLADVELRGVDKVEIVSRWCRDLARAICESGLATDPDSDLYSIAVELHASISEGWLRRIPLEVPC